MDRHRRLGHGRRARSSTGSGLVNITALTADGSRGYPEQAPFDRILVTAAAEDPPGPLLAQMRVGGIMVVPVGQSDTVQSLIKVTRTDTGTTIRSSGRSGSCRSSKGSDRIDGQDDRRYKARDERRAGFTRIER
jgi:protein-L-isoaspartate O-methyltransferase